MSHYEYKFFMVADLSHAQKKMNDEAKEGFELDQFKVVHLHGLRSEFYLVLKRQMTEEPAAS